MVNLSTAQITGIVSLVLILSGAVVVEILEKTYYCPTEDNVKECIRLSDSRITCYYLLAEDITKGDRCTGGKWELFSSYLQRVDIKVQEKSFIISSSGVWYTIDPNEKICYKFGDFRNAMPCP